jgi:uncharacterized protein YfaT (DUF1175 family)
MDDRFISQTALLLISENCSRALSTYLICHKHSDQDHFLQVTKDQINIDESLSWTKFKNDLKALSRQGLLEWIDQDDDTINITLSEWDL